MTKLTDDELRAIAARASWTYVLIAPDVQSIPDTKWYVTRKDTVPVPLILAAPDEGWARGMMDELTRRDNDARLLLAHIRAQDTANARLRDALAAVVGAKKMGVPDGYISAYPDEIDRFCTYCFTAWKMGEPERHAPDCPIAAARRALEGGA